MFRKNDNKYKKVGNHATNFQNCSTFAGKGSFYMRDVEVHSCPELMGLIQEVGFLPLLDSGIVGYSAEAIVDDECRYVVYSDGGWDWPLWKWKGREWWPDLCNWRRSKFPQPAEGSIEETILMTLAENGSLITRELRAACGFTGPNMRGKFDGYITRLQMAARIVTEDFVYPTDKHGREYGWGWSLLTTPEALYGRDACQCERTPEESYQRIFDHLRQLLPEATERQIRKLI